MAYKYIPPAIASIAMLNSDNDVTLTSRITGIRLYTMGKTCFQGDVRTGGSGQFSLHTVHGSDELMLRFSD